MSHNFHRLMRTIVSLAVLVGAAGSVDFLLQAGRPQNSGILLALFLTWVLSPLVGLGFANLWANRWSTSTRVVLYIVTLFISVGSLALYGPVASGTLRMKVGTVFLVVPFASWVLIAITVPLAVLTSGRHSRRVAKSE